MPPPKNTVDFLGQICSFQVVFGARLHACITSYALDVPVVGLIWSEKLRIFAEVIDKKGSFFEEDELEIEQILNVMEQEMHSEYNEQIREELRGLTKKYLDGFIESLEK